MDFNFSIKIQFKKTPKLYWVWLKQVAQIGNWNHYKLHITEEIITIYTPKIINYNLHTTGSTEESPPEAFLTDRIKRNL